MAEHDVEAVWHDFWVPVIDKGAEGKPIGPTITLPRGFFDQIKRELFDYHELISKLPGFFDDITMGRVSKPNTDLDVVCAWQNGYDSGYVDGRDRGYEDGLDEARNRI